MNDLTFIAVKTIEDLNIVRILRNQCRLYMTRFTDEIGYQQQLDWYWSLDLDTNKLFLLKKDNNPIGYGYLRVDSDKVLLTGGLGESERDKGYGKFLFNSLIEESKKFERPIQLEVLKTNTRAFKLYESLGFSTIKEDEEKIYMEIK